MVIGIICFPFIIDIHSTHTPRGEGFHVDKMCRCRGDNHQLCRGSEEPHRWCPPFFDVKVKSPPTPRRCTGGDIDSFFFSDNQFSWTTPSVVSLFTPRFSSRSPDPEIPSVGLRPLAYWWRCQAGEKAVSLTVPVSPCVSRISSLASHMRFARCDLSVPVLSRIKLNQKYKLNFTRKRMQRIVRSSRDCFRGGSRKLFSPK